MYLPCYFSVATAAEAMVPEPWLMSNMFLVTRMIQITGRSKKCQRQWPVLAVMGSRDAGDCSARS